MNTYILDILTSSTTKKEKENAFKELEKSIKIARHILEGKYEYCAECQDYYLTKSFLTRLISKPGKICIYEDPINDGGKEYVDGMIDTTYRICPKGHKKVIKREERKIRNDT